MGNGKWLSTPVPCERVDATVEVVLEASTLFWHLVKMCRHYPDIVEGVLAAVARETAEKNPRVTVNCAFPFRCDNFPCDTCHCNADCCNNGHAYRMS